MTENEAVKLMLNEIVCINTADHNECERDCASCSLVKDTDKLLEAYKMAIQALEKQTPKKPLRDYCWHCPNCEEETYWDTDYGQQKFRYCHNCGQKIDWD